MSEAGANVVMEIIAQYERKVNTRGSTYAYHDLAMLKHWYEMHKLRDRRLYAQLHYMLGNYVTIEDGDTSRLKNMQTF